jgi:hypothetical protein
MSHRPKYLYAAYLNMARHNAYITLSYIAKMVKTEKGKEIEIEEEENLPDTVKRLKNLKAVEEKKKVTDLLLKHFPFLLPMVDNKPSDAGNSVLPVDNYYKILQKVFDLLNYLRNEYTHYKHKETDVPKNFIDKMKNCFDAARRKIAERFELGTDEIKHLDRFIKEKVEQNRRERPTYVENSNFYYKFDNANDQLTPYGLAFFICLFLEKKYAMLFLSQLKGFKRGDAPNYQATKEVFCVYRIRIPNLRIDTQVPVMALVIDMLNELKKCPAELVNLLSKHDLRKFRIIPDKKNSIDTEESEVLLKRHGNRFPYLALKYIDQAHLFPNIRFQVGLGVYRYRFYNKQGVDNLERVRILQKQLKGFGRLNEMEEKRKTEWQTFIRPFEEIKQDTAEEQPYITDSHVKYIIQNNKIGLKWFDRRDNASYLPDLNEKGAKHAIPTCWLSIYELPPLLFHQLLCDNKLDTQNIIRDYVANYRKLFRDIETDALQLNNKESITQWLKMKYKINFTDIPKELQDYLCEKPIQTDRRFKRLSNERIASMLIETQRRLKSIQKKLEIVNDSKRNKVGKKRYVEIKPGELAEFLAKDMLAFQPTKNAGKDKLTGMNFQVLQYSMAYFTQYNDQMKEIFEKSKLLNSPIAHPFLQNIKKSCTNIVDFYIAYLEARQKYLEQCYKSKQYENYYFLHSGQTKWKIRSKEFYQSLAKRYREQPIELPRGLFHEAIRQLLKKEQFSENTAIQEALSKERSNTTFLLRTYFKAIYDDTTQDYYNFKRSYRFFNLINDKRVSNKLVSVYYTTAEFENKMKDKNTLKNYIENYIEKEYKKEEAALKAKHNFRELKTLQENKGSFYTTTREKMHRLLNDFKKNEKMLRLYKTQDILLFLMAKKILLDIDSFQNANIEQYKLKQIMPNSQQDILSVQTPFQITLTKNKRITTIMQDSLKLKNYGDFLRFIHDRRIETLLPYIKEDNIKRQILEEELETYDTKRTAIFELLHQFEEYVISQKEIDESLLSEEEVDSAFVNFVNILRSCPEIPLEKRQQMQIIRNAFSHNSYPSEIVEIKDITTNANTRVNFPLCQGKELPGIAKFLSETLEKNIEV